MEAEVKIADEMKTMSACVRLLEKLPVTARKRVIGYLSARVGDLPGTEYEVVARQKPLFPDGKSEGLL